MSTGALRSATALTLACAAACTLLGCPPTVGDRCDQLEARRVYRDTYTNTPLYAGQALILENCVSCHGVDVQRGAPGGLEFDVSPGRTADEIAAHRSRRQAIYAHRDMIYQQVVGGTMPPPPPAGGLPLRFPAGNRFENAAGEPLPLINTSEGQEMLRNWLACSAPTFDQCDPRAQVCSSATESLEGSVDCEGGRPGPGEIPRWSWIHPCIMVPSCAGVDCHVGGANSGLSLNGLGSLAGLINTRSDPALSLSCGPLGEQSPYLDIQVDGAGNRISGDPNNSLLYQLLVGADENGDPPCAPGMPYLSPTGLALDDLALIERWIQAGAPD